MWLNLSAIFKKLSHDPDVRSIILSSVGPKAFTAGLDVEAASQGDNIGNDSGKGDIARAATKLRRHIYEFQDCITALEKGEKPLIVVMHGYSFGLAIDLSSCADVRICAADTKFSVKEVDIGLAADIGTLTRLPKIVGSMAWVKDVALSARVFGAEEALKQGFVSRVVGTKEEGIKAAIEWAQLVASKSPVAVQGTKELINYSRDHSTEDGLRYTAIWNSAMVLSDDVKSAMLSGLQKRKPTFEKL